MKYHFKLKFTKTKIPYWASRYSYQNEDVMCNVIAPKIQKQKYLNKEDFLFVCRWKSPRPTKQVLKNDESFIKEVTHTSLTTSNPRFAIEVLTLLNGVSWPTASVILHFGLKDIYPILDYRALWSLGIDQPRDYKFILWNQYTNYCQVLAKKCGVSMRQLDRALWQYSKENQNL